MKVLFLVEGEPVRGRSPAARFRVYQLIPHLERAGFRCDVEPSRPAKYFLADWAASRTLSSEPVRLAALVGGTLLMACSRLPALFRAPTYDLVVLQRDLLPLRTVAPVLELALIRRNARVIFDFDDAIFARHSAAEANPDRSPAFGTEKIPRILRACRHVIAGNSYLAEYARRWNSRVSVVPTVVDTDLYRPAAERTPSEAVTIGWSGTHTNLGYLRRVSPVLQRLSWEFPIRLRIFSNPHRESLDFGAVPVEWRPWNPESEVTDLQDLHIGLMPLPEDEWARGKCGLKALLYMACGVPCVLSPVGVNAEIVRSGVTGFAASTEREWYEALRALVSNPWLRARIADEGRQTVIERYSVQRWVPQLARIFRAVASDTPSPRQARVRR